MGMSALPDIYAPVQGPQALAIFMNIFKQSVETVARQKHLLDTSGCLATIAMVSKLFF